MALTTPKNPNYAAVVVRLTAVNALDGCDNIAGAPVLGFQAIVGKDRAPGDVGIVFTAETQLSEEFAHANNLHREPELNADPAEKGYLEKTRRVRAIKLRGHRSDALFMPLESLAHTGFDITKLTPGDTFDELNGHEICRKYEVASKATQPLVEKNKRKTFTRVDQRYLPEHVSTDQYFRVERQIPADTRIVASQKVHGTSIRVGHTLVARKLTWLERIGRKLGVNVQLTEFDYVYASRRVVKDANNPDQQHFYDNDVWTHYGKQLDGLLPKNYIVYGELVGWEPNGKALQAGYTYGMPVGHAELLVYRVAVVNEQGISVDLSWDAVKEFCRDRDLMHVPELWSGLHADFVAEDWLDKRFHDEGYRQALPLDPGKTVDEGVVLRVEGIVPYFAKAKSPAFYAFETKQNDKGVVDLESLGDAA
ncbi:RNA ligase family protein [Nocardia ignorata]|uniref:RNA ligase n=1 Tax=Nocardia ignorata TaxID=145285 RepID=A0A4R6NYN2_NOCIG|nr:RNA ligase family protein [Nocardia ignorata]TDP29799.1 RNA ligase [Nocardia ignorata]